MQAQRARVLGPTQGSWTHGWHLDVQGDCLLPGPEASAKLLAVPHGLELFEHIGAEAVGYRCATVHFYGAITLGLVA